MKTNSNVRKNNLSLTVLFAGLFITGITSAANSVKISANDASSNVTFENAAENKIGLEGWMTDETYFATKAGFETSPESTMEIEPWMMNENNFVTSTIEATGEKPIETENWMTDESNFSTKSIINTEAEQPMVIEPWMTDGLIFSKTMTVPENVRDEELKIEDWMLNNKNWK